MKGICKEMLRKEPKTASYMEGSGSERTFVICCSKCKGWKKWFALFSVQVETETGNARRFCLILIGILYAMFSTSTGTDIKDFTARFLNINASVVGFERTKPRDKLSVKCVSLAYR
jgi:hypothetical protein